MFLFTAVWRKSLRKMTLSPVWTKGACSARGEAASAGSKTKEQNGAETAWRHPHPTQSPEATPTAQTQQLPHPIQAGGHAGALHTEQPVSPWHPGHSWGQASLQGSHRHLCSGAPRHKFPQTTLTCPRADPTPCSQSLQQAESHSC